MTTLVIRVLTAVLVTLAAIVTIKVGIAALGAVILGLTVGSLEATFAGIFGLVVTVWLWNLTDDLFDRVLPGRTVE